MKKKIFGAVVVLAIAAGAMINVNLNKVSTNGDLALANVEVLAQAEIRSGDACYSGGVYNADKPQVVKCGTPCIYETLTIYGNTTTSYCH